MENNETLTEYWDIYTENREPTGRTIKRGDAFAEGEYYVCCEVWITNSNGEMLMTRRHPAKKAGGLWEFSGGGVLAGETTKQAAVREVREELGLAVAESELNLLTVYRSRNYFMDIFTAKRDVELSALHLQPEEVTDAKWVSGEEVEGMIANGEVVKSVAVRYHAAQTQTKL